MQCCRLGQEWLESCSAETTDSCVTMSQQRAQVAKDVGGMLTCTKDLYRGSRTRAVIIPLYLAIGEVTPPVMSPVLGLSLLKGQRGARVCPQKSSGAGEGSRKGVL